MIVLVYPKAVERMYEHEHLYGNGHGWSHRCSENACLASSERNDNKNINKKEGDRSKDC